MFSPSICIAMHLSCLGLLIHLFWSLLLKAGIQTHPCGQESWLMTHQKHEALLTETETKQVPQRSKRTEQEKSVNIISLNKTSYISVSQLSRSVMSNSLVLHGLQHTRLPCPSPTLRTCSNSCPSSWYYHPTISSSVIPFSCLQSFPESGSFTMSQFFASSGQSIGASASASVLPMNIQDWFSLGWTGWISLQSKGLSRVFSNITVQKYQFFSTQLSL